MKTPIHQPKGGFKTEKFHCYLIKFGVISLKEGNFFFFITWNIHSTFFSLGPRQIRAESCLLRPYNNATGAAPFESLMVADLGDIPINTYNLAATVEIIHKHIATIAGYGCVPLVLGGDHTISYPILKGIKVSRDVTDH